MRRRFTLFTVTASIFVTVVAAIPGCSGVLHLCERVYPPISPSTHWDGAAEPEAARGKLIFDSATASSIKEVDEVLSLDLAPSGYAPMTPAEVQCLAAGAATIGALIDQEMGLLGYLAAASKDRRARVLWIQKDLSELRATTLRNDAAAAALTLYYHIAAAEAQKNLLPDLLMEITETKKVIEQYRAIGQDIPTDDTEIDRQAITVHEQEKKLAATLSQLNGKLRLLFSSPAGPAPYIWPQDDFTVLPSNVDIDAAIALGLRQRADLTSLRIVHNVLNQDTLPLARAVLQQQEGILGVPSTQLALFHQDRIAREMAVRDVQLAIVLTSAENAAIDEIRKTAEDVAQALREVGAAKEKLVTRQNRLKTVEKQIALGRMGRHEPPLARLELIRAKSEMIQKVIDWKIAVVNLRQTQGVLAADCGYPRCFEMQYDLRVYDGARPTPPEDCGPNCRCAKNDGAHDAAPCERQAWSP